MKKLLNNTNAIIMIGLIGLLLGALFQWLILFNHLTEANQKLDMLLDQEGDIVCKVSIIDGYYYYVCDEVIAKMPSL